MRAPAKLELARRRLCLGAVLAFLVTGAAMPSDLAAAHSVGHYLLRPYRAIRFRVHGSYGYVIGVVEGSRRHFAVTVRRGSTITEYRLRAARPASQFDVRSKLGELGAFDVHFTPRGKPRQLPRHRWCEGPGPTIQPGIVRGEIRFEGERGYTRAVAHFANAELETLPSQRCHYLEVGHSKHPPRYTATLDAAQEGGGHGVYFDARRFALGSRPPARRVFYAATEYDQIGRIRISREIRVAATTPTFKLPNFALAPETAVIEPPAPFTGSATFSRTPESTFNWTGDLAVSLPGIDPVSLVGPDFRLDYCALRDCVSQGVASRRTGTVLN